MKPKIIAILTDFGIDDPFVGIMKAVIAEITPDPTIIDITHQIPPGDIQRGAFVLWQAARDFPDGTVFLVVIDPGVGTDRKAIYYTNGKHIVICPDNGLISYIRNPKSENAWELSNPRYQRSGKSATFHGRDIFAPGAAHAASGIIGDQFGNPVHDLVTLSKPNLLISSGSINGEVLSIDHFGNLITSLGLFIREGDHLTFSSWLSDDKIDFPDTNKIRIKINSQTFSLVDTFGAVQAGEIAGVIGSTGLIEICANQASAQQALRLTVGDSIELVWE